MFKSDRILALDVGAGTLKAGWFVPLKAGGLQLVRYAVRELNSDPAADEGRLAEITTAVKDVMAEFGVSSGRVLLSVPGQSVFSRFVKLPPASRDQILKVVQYEAQQNVPFPINEVVWDYQLIGSGGAEIDVMLAAIKADIIEQLTDAIVAAGLEPDLVDVASTALYNTVRYNYAELPPCVLLIDIGARSTDLVFIEENRVFNRSIPVGGNSITQQIMREFDLSYEDAEKLKKAHAFVAFGGAYETPASEVADKVSKSVRSVMTRLHAEINRSINFYRTQQSGGQPTLALLTGGSSTIPYTDTFLKDKLQLDVDYLNPFQNVSVDPSIPAEDIGRQAHLMGEVVGLALRRVLTCPIEINLLPPTITEAKAFRHKQPFFVVSMAFAILILVVWSFYFFKLSMLGRTRLERVRAQVAALESVERRLKAVEDRFSEVERKDASLVSLPGRRTQWVRVVSAIHERLPDGMWVVGLSPFSAADPRGGTGEEMPPPDMPPPETGGSAVERIDALRVTLFAYTDKLGDTAAFQLRDSLRTCPLFSDATDIVVLPIAGGDDPVLEFTLKVALRDPIEL